MSYEEYTSTKKGDVLDLLEELKNTVENAKGVFLSQNCMVNREYFLSILGAITNNLPSELKQAKWVLDQQQQFIQQARKESSAILATAENKAAQMIDESVIAKKAMERAEELINEAQEQADELRMQAVNYTHEKLSDIDELLTQVLLEIRKQQKF